MRNNKVLSLGILILATATTFAQDSGQQPITVVVDGTPLRFNNQQPAKIHDRVLVPLRGIFERLGASVKWDPSTQTVHARRGDRTIDLTIGVLDAAINGQASHLDVPASLVGGSTMVPLRFVSEALGASITWNDQQQEADIVSPPPVEERRRDNDRRTPPPVLDRRPPPHVVVPPRSTMDVIAEDSVLPFSLNTRLSSSNAQVGDTFNAYLITDNHRRYMGLPDGTMAYGHVQFVRARRGNDAGVIELRVDNLVTPGGWKLNVEGRLIGLDDKSVNRNRDGSIVAKNSERNDRVVYTGAAAGAGAGLLLGLNSKRPLEDAAIGGVLGALIGSATDRAHTNDVQLVPGTRFGVRLHRPLSMGHNLK